MSGGHKGSHIDDTRRLGAALKRRGVEHEIKIYPGGIHGFHVVFWSDRARLRTRSLHFE